MIKYFFLFVLIFFLCNYANSQVKNTLTIGMGKTALSFTIDDKGTPAYAVSFNNKPVINSSKLGFALKNMNPGDISQPQNYTDERGKTSVRIIFLKSRTEPHRENMKNDYDRIAQRALQIKKETLLENWFTHHVTDFYIDVDKGFSNCDNIKKWWNVPDSSADKD